MQEDNSQFLESIASNKALIYKIASSYAKDEANKKDLIQEIVLQLWLAYPRYDPAFKLSTWMYRIALNVCISQYRKESRRIVINQKITDDLLHFPEESKPIDANPALAALHQGIKELKEIDRAVILLYLEEKSHQEISEILGLSVTNISTKVARIKQQLKLKLTTLNN